MNIIIYIDFEKIHIHTGGGIWKGEGLRQRAICLLSTVITTTFIHVPACEPTSLFILI